MISVFTIIVDLNKNDFAENTRIRLTLSLPCHAFYSHARSMYDKWAMVMVIRMRRSFQSNSKISSNLSISGLYRCSLGGKKKKKISSSSGRRIEYT